MSRREKATAGVCALEALADWADARLRAAVVETTGMADVGPVLALLKDPEDPLYARFATACVCVVAAGPELFPEGAEETWSR